MQKAAFPIAHHRGSRQPLVRASLIAAGYAAAASMLIGLAVLVGYTFGWRFIWRPMADARAIHPMTATLLIALGLAALLQRPRQRSRVSLCIAIGVAILAVSSLFCIVTGHGAILDEVFPFHDVFASEAARGRPLRISTLTVVTMFLLALALYFRQAGHSSAAQLIVGTASVGPISALLGCFYGMSSFRADMGPITTIGSLTCAFAIAGRIAHRVPLRSVLTINLPGPLVRTQLVILIGLCLALALVAARSGFDDDVRTLAMEVAVLTVIIALALINAAYRWQQEEQRKRTRRDDPDAPLARELEGAWERGELFLLYQPQIRLADGVLVGVEALVRWQHPGLGMVGPDAFIRIAERFDLIHELGAWVFETACRQAALWQNTPFAELKMSVNVSARQLEKDGCAERMIAFQQDAGIAPGRLVIEVTESTLIERGDKAVRALRQLTAQGMLVAIDDFGTGYSSLSSLRILPSQYLKIDKSFVTELPVSGAAGMIVRAIVGMGRGLGMKVIAEGVETIEQATFLKKIGCEKAQGYLYGRPMTPDEIRGWTKNTLVSTA